MDSMGGFDRRVVELSQCPSTEICTRGEAVPTTYPTRDLPRKMPPAWPLSSNTFGNQGKLQPIALMDEYQVILLWWPDQERRLLSPGSVP
jgi:hypothetical protein